MFNGNVIQYNIKEFTNILGSVSTSQDNEGATGKSTKINIIHILSNMNNIAIFCHQIFWNCAILCNRLWDWLRISLW